MLNQNKYEILLESDIGDDECLRSITTCFTPRISPGHPPPPELSWDRDP